MEKIEPGRLVELGYDLYQVDGDGKETLVHQTDIQDPEKIVYGVTRGVILPLEKALEGLSKGDTFEVSASAEEAFGPVDTEQVVTLEKDIFLVDGKFDAEMVKEGNYVPMMTAEGYRINGRVVKVSDTDVTLDFNHPLAGKAVKFKGRVLDVREPSAEELHPACGCGGGCGDGSCGGGCEGGCEGGDGSCGCR